LSAAVNLLKKLLLRWDIALTRPPGRFYANEHKLLKARKRGLSVAAAVDGGAAEGEWTRSFLKVFPGAAMLCVEPRADGVTAMASLMKEYHGIHVAQALLGPEERDIEFNVHGEQSSVLPNSQGKAFGQVTRMHMTTLDGLVKRIGFPAPDFIKLDLQGSELACLDGASQCLAHAQAVQLEVSFLPFQMGMPLIAETLEYMRAKGFVCYDILALWNRPLDGALAQGDFLFLRRESILRSDARWAIGADFS